MGISMRNKWIFIAISLLIVLNLVFSLTNETETEVKEIQTSQEDGSNTLLTENAPRRNLGSDDLVDEDDFDDDDDVDNSDDPVMAPANTRVDEEKSSNINKHSQVTDSEITRMFWCGQTTNIILGQTNKGQIYRSIDNGETWEFKHDYDKLDGVGQLDKKNVKKASKIADIIESPVDPNLVFLIGASGVNWVSED